MLKSLEATIETDGQIHLREHVRLQHTCRAIVTIIDEVEIPETALLSEAVLREDWNRPEEDRAWSHFQPWINTQREWLFNLGTFFAGRDQSPQKCYARKAQGRLT